MLQIVIAMLLISIVSSNAADRAKAKLWLAPKARLLIIPTAAMWLFLTYPLWLPYWRKVF